VESLIRGRMRPAILRRKLFVLTRFLYSVPQLAHPVPTPVYTTTHAGIHASDDTHPYLTANPTLGSAFAAVSEFTFTPTRREYFALGTTSGLRELGQIEQQLSSNACLPAAFDALVGLVQKQVQCRLRYDRRRH